MNVVNMMREVVLVAQRMLPVAPLPDSTLTLACDALRDWFKAVAKSLDDVDATPYRWWDVK